MNVEPTPLREKSLSRMKTLFFFSLLLPGLVAAETMDFAQMQQYALFNNPSIQAAYHTIDQARGRLLQAGLWPNPELALGFRTDRFFGGEGLDRVSAGLMQRVPWSGRLGRAQALSRVEVAMALTDVRNEERKLIFEVQKAFIEAQAASEKTSALQKLMVSLDSLIRLNEARRQAGGVTAIAVNISRVEKEGLRQRLIAHEADEAAALARLKGLLGMQPTAKFAIGGSLATTIGKLRDSTSSRMLYRPDLVRASLGADAAAAEIALARAETWEDITVGVEYEFEKMANGEMGIMDVNFLGFRANIPLPAWNRNQGRIAEQTASQSRARQELIAAKITIEAEIEAARVRSSKSAAVAAIIAKDSLPLLDETHGILESAIQTGQAQSFSFSTMMVFLLPGVVALVFGFLAFRSRIKGVYFSILTQALTYGASLMFFRNDMLMGGNNGFTNFKSILSMPLVDAANPARASATMRGIYIFTSVSLLVVYAGCRWLSTTKFGLVQRAIRDGENRVLFSGYSAPNFKLFVFVLSAMIASLGGALFVPLSGIINPSEMTPEKSLEAVVWCAVGGRGTIVGPILGAVSVNALKSWAVVKIPDLWLILMGGIFILVVLFMPKGIVGLPAQFGALAGKLRSQSKQASTPPPKDKEDES
jgi:urea transport system permease protein